MCGVLEERRNVSGYQFTTNHEDMVRGKDTSTGDLGRTEEVSKVGNF